MVTEKTVYTDSDLSSGFFGIRIVEVSIIIPEET